MGAPGPEGVRERTASPGATPGRRTRIGTPGSTATDDAGVAVLGADVPAVAALSGIWAGTGDAAPLSDPETLLTEPTPSPTERVRV